MLNISNSKVFMKKNLCNKIRYTITNLLKNEYKKEIKSSVYRKIKSSERVSFPVTFIVNDTSKQIVNS